MMSGRLRAAIGNRPARRDECVWRCDDFVAKLDVEHAQRDVQRGSAAVEAERVLRAAELREVLFKLCDVRPEAERTVVQRAGERGVNFLADAFDLRGQVEIWNFFWHFEIQVCRSRNWSS